MRHIRLILTVILQTILSMRNWGDPDKFEKIGRQAIRKLPKFKGKKYLFTALLGSGWFIYDQYKQHGKRQSQTVNVFEWKRKIAAEVQKQDFWQKITTFSVGSIESPNKRYQQLLKQRFTTDILTETFRVSEDSPKKEFILTQHIQHKADITLLQLHSYKSYLLIDSNNSLVKRSYTIPFSILGIPISLKKKESIRSSHKKSKAEKFIENKSRFKLSSECKSINKYNGYFLDKKQKRQLLHECRQTIEKLEEILVKELVETSKVYFEAERQYDLDEKQNEMSIRLSDDILRQ